MVSDNLSAFNSLEYDQKIKQTIPYYEEMYHQVTDMINVYFRKPVKWLDVGCGSGKMAEIAFQCCSIDKVVACDSSDKMTTITQNRFIDKPIEVVTSSIKDFDTHEQFDVITAIQVFHYFREDERIEAIKKCYSLLKTKGIFITFENFAANSELGKQLLLERWKSFQLSKGKSLEEANDHISRYGKAYYPITTVEHVEVLKQCGFIHTEILWVSNMQVGLLGIKE